MARLLWLVIKAGLIASAEIRVEREKIARRNAEIVARADYEHSALLDGDLVLGVHGQFPPAW